MLTYSRQLGTEHRVGCITLLLSPNLFSAGDVQLCPSVPGQRSVRAGQRLRLLPRLHRTLARTGGGCYPGTRNSVSNEDCCITMSDTESDWRRLYFWHSNYGSNEYCCITIRTLNQTGGGCTPGTRNYAINDDFCFATSDTVSDWL